ncbi:MAG: ATP-binding protein [Rickettsiales bacterium]|jgi:SpoVK/Ycf46/Vps4 family AAA+-type ATPase|nr:ATP-binding protein [Rickettsiales bacterium]
MATENPSENNIDDLQLIVLRYLGNGLRPRVPIKIRNQVLNWFNNHDDDFFNPENIKEAQDMIRKSIAPPPPVIPNTTLPYTLEAARALVNLETKGRDVEAEWKRINKRFELVFDIFDVDQGMREILRFMIHSFKGGAVLGSLWEAFCEFGNFYINTENKDAIALITNSSPEQVDDFLDPESPCFEKGILAWEAEVENYISLSRKFRSIISCKHETKKEILEFILRKKQTASLSPDDFKYIHEIYDHCKNLLKNALDKKTTGVNILLRGAPGTGKSEMAKTLASETGADLYSVADGKTHAEKGDRIAELAMIQSLFGDQAGVILVFDEADDIFFNGPFEGKEANSKLFINNLLEKNKVPTIWTTNVINYIEPAYIRRFMYTPEIPKPDEDATKNIWKNISVKKDFAVPDAVIARLAKRYDLPPSFIETAIAGAKLVGDEKTLEPTIESLLSATDGYVKKNDDPRLEFFDPSLLNTDMDLEMLSDRIISLKKMNFSLFLYGVPGTGKSVYARYLAKKMRLPVIRKRGSDLLDKYIGETEKNIADAFQIAKDKKAMLIIDEADSFLQDRNRAVRQWEVTGVNEMLTHMEENEYPLVCTSNLTNSIDTAAFRRFNFKVKYDYMKPGQAAAAFKHFFGQEIQPASAIHELKSLTPGDFAVVKENAQIMGITDQFELIKMLAKEIELKRLDKTVGFGM